MPLAHAGSFLDWTETKITDAGVLELQKYLPVVRYLPPSEFDFLGEKARQMGFENVASGPFVRSSYHAKEMADTEI